MATVTYIWYVDCPCGKLLLHPKITGLTTDDLPVTTCSECGTGLVIRVDTVKQMLGLEAAE